MVVCKEHAEQINTLCGQGAETLVLNVTVHTVTIRLSWVLVLGSRSVIAVGILCTTCECFYTRSQNCEKATTSFVTSVRPPIRLSAWNISAPTGPILIKFCYLRIFRKYVEKNDVD